jgi:hypothetical protein
VKSKISELDQQLKKGEITEFNTIIDELEKMRKTILEDMPSEEKEIVFYQH